MPQILYTEQELRELAELQEIDKSLHSQYRDVAAERSNFLEKKHGTTNTSKQPNTRQHCKNVTIQASWRRLQFTHMQGATWLKVTYSGSCSSFSGG